MIKLLLLLTLLVGQPQAVHRQDFMAGLPSESNPKLAILKSRSLRVEAYLYAVQDLRDTQQLRVRLEVANRGQKLVHYRIFVAVLDREGRLLGAVGFPEKLEAGRTNSIQKDVAMPARERDRAASYQVVLYEDTQEVGKR